MAWASARAALVTLLDGATADAGADYQNEVLRAYEYPPNAADASVFPFAFIHPPRELVDVTFPNVMHHAEIEARVEVVLGPSSNDFRALAMRRDAWATTFRDKATLSTSLNLSGAVSAVTQWTLGELRASDWFATAEGAMWGFDLIVAMNTYEE